MDLDNKKIDVVILAAGMGTRMKSSKPKMLHELLGKPMVCYILDAVRELCAEPPVVVVGSGAEQVKAKLGASARYALQDPQLGTADAVKRAKELLKGRSGTVIVANSDFPLITARTYTALLEEHVKTGSKLTISTIITDDPRGFGRILRDKSGRIMGIVEDKAATPEQQKIKELNSNPYCFDAQWLWDSLDKVEKSAVGEYYLTDLVKIAYDEGLTVGSIVVADPDESIGINTRVHLAEASKALRKRINTRWMLEGVTMIDPEKVYIEDSVTIGRDTILFPEVYLRGSTDIGESCEIGPSVVIKNTQIGERCRVQFAVLESARLENDVDMGPFAHLRKGAHLDEHVHMGNFGEVKNSHLGPGTKMGHFSYIGDAEIGPNVNIGAGTVTCNFDGEGKFKTEIGEGAFIGSDTMLVAPVRIGKGAKTGAGSVVTHDVPDESIVVGVPAKPLKKKPD
jgi:bifunctional UDP-N-acetylglucosamine pyrophosphorylase/glucosamine-1-phosphate N-acetyltransferase